GALTVSEHGQPYARQPGARAVQGVHQLRLRPGTGSIADAGTARLEVVEVGARADLEPLLAARRPDLDVVLHRCLEREIAGAHLHHAVGQPEPPAHRLGVAEERQQPRIASLRPHGLAEPGLVALAST